MKEKYTVIDLFSGAGGLTEGFIRHSFDFVAHVEMNEYATQTLDTRIRYHKLCKNGKKDFYYRYFSGEITREDFIAGSQDYFPEGTGIYHCEISPETESDIIDSIRKRLENIGEKSIDVIIGGPPCQAYSLAGRGRSKDGMVNDPRNLLYLYYLKAIETFKPKIFVFENVPGIISSLNGKVFEDFNEKIGKLGYCGDPNARILNAADFGVLQNRKRIIYIGWRKGLDFEYPDFQQNKSEFNTGDLFHDLPPLYPGEGSNDHQKYLTKRSSGYLKEKGLRTDEPVVRNHIARNHNERDREIYRKVISKWESGRERLHYDELPEELKTHKKRKVFTDRFKVIDKEGLSHAVLAHLAKDGHYFIYPDIKYARSITVREAARIQSFPDNYLFEGPRTAQYVQIGNAVPPLMASGIAKEIEIGLNRN